MKSKAIKVGVINSAWLNWYPHRGFHAAFWISVAKRVKARGISKNDRESVLAVCREVNAKYPKNTTRKQA